MQESKALYIIVEGKTDAQILHTLLDCRQYEHVYHIPVGGYGNMSSTVTTIRLLKIYKPLADKILVVFDSDSTKKDVIEDRLATMRYLTNADFDDRIGVFCFVPDIEGALFPNHYPKRKGITKDLVQYMEEHIEGLREKDEIKKIQTFVSGK